MSCCGNCDVCTTELDEVDTNTIIVLYAASVEDLRKIALENPGKLILVRDWEDAPVDVKAEAFKVEEMKRYYEQKHLEIQQVEREEKIHNQGRDQWKHRQKYHSR